MTSRVVQQSQTLCPLQPAGNVKHCSNILAYIRNNNLPFKNGRNMQSKTNVTAFSLTLDKLLWLVVLRLFSCIENTSAMVKRR